LKKEFEQKEIEGTENTKLTLPSIGLSPYSPFPPVQCLRMLQFLVFVGSAREPNRTPARTGSSCEQNRNAFEQEAFEQKEIEGTENTKLTRHQSTFLRSLRFRLFNVFGSLEKQFFERNTLVTAPN
jgi:hypothetical protein